MENPANAKFYNWLTHKIFQDVFLAQCERHLKGSLIDIGCGLKPYEKYLSGLVTEHIGVDHPGTLHDKSRVDIFGTAYNIPVENERFDSAICTAVLEHLEEPADALQECHRVLKPGGCAIYSVPFIWHLHEEPRDFYRYSKHGLAYLFDKTGFEVKEIVPLAGFWVTFIQLFLYWGLRFDRSFIKFLHLYRFFAWFFQCFAMIMHRFDKSFKWTWMYIIVAVKR